MPQLPVLFYLKAIQYSFSNWIIFISSFWLVETLCISELILIAIKYMVEAPNGWSIYVSLIGTIHNQTRTEVDQKNVSRDFKCYHSEKVLNRYKFKGKFIFKNEIVSL